MRVNEIAGDCLDGNNTVEGAVPAVGPNGEVYAAWAGPAGLVFIKSSNGGQTFSKNIKAGEIAGWDYEIEGLYRCDGLPITGCDISDGIYRGNIYINWSDQKYGKKDTDIFLVRSTDGGETWCSPVRVNDDAPGKQQFMSWMSVDAVMGYVYVLFYDRRAYNNQETDVELAVSSDGGSSFKNIKVSENPFIPVSNVFFGDYIGVSAYNGFAACLWQRMDEQALSIIYCGVRIQ
jgi:hypothetical protein